MREDRVARRFFVTGMVQGVGYRFFAQRAAQRLGVAGYAKNLRDGRVEIYAVGVTAVLEGLRVELRRGPRAAQVSGIAEEHAPIEARFALEFSIEYDE